MRIARVLGSGLAASEEKGGDMPETYYCYMFSAGRYVKIGYTGDLGRRLEMTRTHCPFAVNVLCLFPHPTREGAMAHEAELHKRMRRFHVRGEWFKRAPVEKYLAKSGVDGHD